MMENDNILNEEIKIKKNYKIPLIVIGVLMVLLIGFGCYFYLSGGSPRDTYIKVLDSFAAGVSEIIDNVDNTKPMASDLNVSFNLNSNDSDIKDLAAIINKMDLNLKFESDYVNKNANFDLGLKYDNKEFINGSLYLKDTDAYANLGDLYSKTIKIPLDDMEEIWNVYDKKTINTLLDEMVSIIKNNLKEDYFSEESEKITIYGKEVNVLKHTMTLTGKDLYDFENAILNDMESNDNLIKALVELTNMTESEIKDLISSSKENIVLDEEINIIVEIYLNKVNKNVEKVVIVGDEDKIILNKEKENETVYEIVYKSDKEESIGELNVTDNSIALNINYDGVEINYEILSDEENSKINVAMKMDDDEINLEVEEKNGKGQGVITVISSLDDIDLKVNFDYELKEIDEVSSKDISNSINYEMLTDDDYNNIMLNLYQNEAFNSLIQDLNYSDANSLLATY